MQLATWNVNSLKMRLQHVLDWLAANPVDFLCLQETKLTDDKFPKDEIEAAGYVPEGVQLNNPLHEDVQRRLVSARFQTAAGPVRVIGAYFPNGQAVGSEKYVYKLGWIASLQEWIAQLRREEPDTGVILAGDFNIAPADADVHDPAVWADGILVSGPERQALQGLLALGLHDAFRLFEQPPKLFSWWDYRALGFRRNAGLRIDLILVSDELKPMVGRCWIDKGPRKLEKPSDHTPVVVEWGAAAT